MIGDLKPYPACKESGVAWLGQVPAHWEVSTLRRKLRPYDGIKIGPFGSQLKLEQMSASGFKVYGQANVIARDFARGTKYVDVKKFDELSACKVQPGDLVITMMGTSGRCARVPETADAGIMDSHLLRLRVDATIDAGFAALVIDKAPYIKEQISAAGKGSIMHGLNSSMVKDLVLACPPLPEQASAVRFIDHVDRRIRRYIRAKQRLIALLNEQKQATIHSAVTRGLDPNVRLKPSGVEWLGDVPEHWEVRPLKHLVPQVTVGIVIQPARLYVSSGVPCLRSLNISSGVVRADNLVFISAESNKEHRKSQILTGDLVVVRTGQAGVAAVVPPEFDGANCIDLLVVRQSPRIISDYLLTYLNSWGARTDVQYRSVGAIQAHYNTATLANLVVPLPPETEQRAILDDVSRHLEPVVRSEGATSREIALLREYRTRLIADVVTGKLDVREAAALLPQEAGESEPVDPADDSVSDDEEQIELSRADADEGAEA